MNITIATLLSRNEENSIQVTTRASTEDGQLWLAMSEGELDRAEMFLDGNGLSGVYFDPSITPVNYRTWVSDENGITFYN